MNEISLIKKLKKGDADALDYAIKTYSPYISVVLFNMCGGNLGREDTEEIVSDVFVALWRNAAKINLEKGSIRSYLAGTVRNLTAMRLREKHINTVQIDESIDIAAKNTPEEQLLEIDRDIRLWRAVTALGEPDSEIFVRYYRYGEKIREIAVNMGIKAATVKTKLSRGRKKLMLETEGLL